MFFEIETECPNCFCREELVVLFKELSCGNCGKETVITFEIVMKSSPKDNSQITEKELINDKDNYSTTAPGVSAKETEAISRNV